MAHMTVRTGYQQTVCVSLECYLHLSERQPKDLHLQTQGRETVAGYMKNVTIIAISTAIFSGFCQLSTEGESYGTVYNLTKEA
jgi:hypothetical protein